MRLKKFWKSPKTTSSEDSGGCESPTKITIPKINHPPPQSPIVSKPGCSLPLLQVWPSQVCVKTTKQFQMSKIRVNLYNIK